LKKRERNKAWRDRGPDFEDISENELSPSKIRRKILVLALVFIGSLFLFSLTLNRGNMDVTIQIKDPTYPLVSFSLDGGRTVNTTRGYASEMSIPSLRDTVIATGGTHSLTAIVDTYGNKIQSVRYTVYDLSGETAYESGSPEMTDAGNGQYELKFEFNDTWRDEREGALCLELDREGQNPVYYYTRVTRQAGLSTADCVDFAYEFSANTMNPNESSWVQQYTESSSSGDSTTFQNVTLNSSLNQIMWKNLTLANVSDRTCDIEETNGTFTSLTLSYTLDVTGSGEARKYKVEEFYRLRYSASGVMLLNFVRTMNSSLQDNPNFITASGIDLGVSDSNVSYLSSTDGKRVTFAADDALWLYDQSADKLEKIFTFRLDSGNDARADYSNYTITPVYMDDTGNISFTVTGYMNRGTYEGNVGTAVYYYSAKEDTVSVKTFIPSDTGSAIAAIDLKGLIYYSHTDDIVYALISDKLYKMNTVSGELETLAEGITRSECAVSEDGRYLAYPSADNHAQSATMVLMDLETGSAVTLTAESGAYLKAIGFVDEDFVCGAVRQSDVSQDTLGTSSEPMYKVTITDTTGASLKEYQQEGVYITSVSTSGGYVTLNRATGSGGNFTAITTDYITSNAGSASEMASVGTYSDATLLKCVRIKLASTIQNTSPGRSEPEYLLSTDPVKLNLEAAGSTTRYYTYGFGKLQGIYDTAGAAITAADSVSGVVIDSRGSYVWERGNRDLTYSVSGLEPRTTAEDGSDMSACAKMILIKEGAATDGVSGSLSGTDITDVLSKALNRDILNLSGVTVEQLCYVVDQNTPVIAVTSGGAVLLTGYDKTSVTYTDPATGGSVTVKLADATTLFAAGGSYFIGYVSR